MKLATTNKKKSVCFRSKQIDKHIFSIVQAMFIIFDAEKVAFFPVLLSAFFVCSSSALLGRSYTMFEHKRSMSGLFVIVQYVCNWSINYVNMSTGREIRIEHSQTINCGCISDYESITGNERSCHRKFIANDSISIFELNSGDKTNKKNKFLLLRISFNIFFQNAHLMVTRKWKLIEKL